MTPEAKDVAKKILFSLRDQTVGEAAGRAAVLDAELDTARLGRRWSEVARLSGELEAVDQQASSLPEFDRAMTVILSILAQFPGEIRDWLEVGGVIINQEGAAEVKGKPARGGKYGVDIGPKIMISILETGRIPDKQTARKVLDSELKPDRQKVANTANQVIEWLKEARDKFGAQTIAVAAAVLKEMKPREWEVYFDLLAKKFGPDTVGSYLGKLSSAKKGKGTEKEQEEGIMLDLVCELVFDNAVFTERGEGEDKESKNVLPMVQKVIGIDDLEVYATKTQVVPPGRTLSAEMMKAREMVLAEEVRLTKAQCEGVKRKIKAVLDGKKAIVVEDWQIGMKLIQQMALKIDGDPKKAQQIYDIIFPGLQGTVDTGSGLVLECR